MTGWPDFFHTTTRHFFNEKVPTGKKTGTIHLGGATLLKTLLSFSIIHNMDNKHPCCKGGFKSKGTSPVSLGVSKNVF